MTDSSIIKKCLREQLIRSGFYPGRAAYNHTRNVVTKTGIKAFDEMAACTGRRNWDYFLKKSPLTSAAETFVTVSGYGQLLTQYFIAPIGIADQEILKKCCEMGFLTNMIVSVYDHALDNAMTSSKALLPKTTLIRLINNGQDFKPRFSILRGTKIAKILYGLIKRYITLLNTISVNEAVKSKMMELILEMYDAENATISDAHIPDKDLSLKNRNPFLLMGMSPWLSIRTVDRTFFEWHTRWLMQIGDIFGKVDDIVDLDSDIKQGNPNHLPGVLDPDNHCEKQIEILAENLVKQCISVEEQWRTRVATDSGIDHSTSRAFAACVCSWLGCT